MNKMKKRVLPIVTALIAAATVLVLGMLTTFAARPGIVLGSGTTLFNYLDGAKGSAVGVLNAVATGDGEYKSTTVDTSRRFSVFENSASTVTGGRLSFTYSGATVGANEYVSVIITDATDKVLYYGKLKSVTSSAASSGTVELALPELNVSTTYNLLFFSEQCTATGDKASAFSPVSLLIFPDPYILTTTLPETTQGVNYSYRLTADTTAASCTWKISSGSLPDGMRLDPNTGIISGAPTKAKTYTFNVTVTADSHSYTSGLTLKVNPPISIAFSTNLSEASVKKLSVPKNRTLLLSATPSGGTPTYSNYQWLVNGKSISGATNTTYRVPTSSIGTFTYTFAVSDSATANASASIVIEVREPITPKLSHATVTFDKAAPTAIKITKNDGDYTFTGSIKSIEKTLALGNDFTISSNEITLPANTLNSFALGNHTLTLDYDDTTADPSFTLSVIDSSLPPQLGPLKAPAAIERGSKLVLTPPTVTTWGAAVTSQGWKIKLINGAEFVNFDPSATLDCSYNGASLIYYATNSAGTTNSNTVIITVTHTPIALWQTSATEHWHKCPCGQTFDRENHKCDSNGDCSVCGYHCSHMFPDYKSNNDASCTADGTKTRKCSLCGYVDTVTDPGTALGHKWSGWQVNDTQHWHTCTSCNQKADVADHVPGAPATTETPQTCTVCGKVLKERLPSGTTVPGGHETSRPDSGTTAPGGHETSRPGSGTTTPGGHETSRPDSGTTTPGGSETSRPDSGTTTPSGNATTTAPDDTTSNTPNKNEIKITRTDDGDGKKPIFKTDPAIPDVTLITVDGRPYTRDEYTLSPDGQQLELHPSGELSNGRHTLVIETPNGRGQITFTTGNSRGGSFPFWILWVIPHVFVDIAGLICIALLAIKRDDDKDDTSTESNGSNDAGSDQSK